MKQGEALPPMDAECNVPREDRSRALILPPFPRMCTIVSSLLLASWFVPCAPACARSSLCACVDGCVSKWVCPLSLFFSFSCCWCLCGWLCVHAMDCSVALDGVVWSMGWFVSLLRGGGGGGAFSPIHPRPSTTHHVWHDTSTPKRDRRAPAPCTARRALVRLLRRRRRTKRKIRACTTRATTGRPFGTAAATTATHTNIRWWNASTSCWKRSDKVQVQRYVHPYTARHNNNDKKKGRGGSTANRGCTSRWKATTHEDEGKTREVDTMEDVKGRDAMERRRTMAKERLTESGRGRRTHRRTVHDACHTTKSWP